MNLAKSSAVFSANMLDPAKRRVLDILGVEETELGEKYLGLPSVVGRGKKAVFEYVKDMVWKRISGWSKKFLAGKGKEVVIRTVALAVPNYVMSAFELPLGTCSDIELMLNKFWWSNGQESGMHWLSWKKLCVHKAGGGLGFKDIHNFNVAMLGKQLWRIIEYPDSLAAKILKARYSPRTSVLEAKPGYHPSFVWRSMLAAQDLMKKGLRWRIGDGESVFVFKDAWLSDNANPYVTSPTYEELEGLKVKDLIDGRTKNWDVELISQLFNERDQKLILSIPIGRSGRADSMVWWPEVHGFFSVKSAYRLLQNDGAVEVGGTDLIWKSIWNLGVPGKVKHCLWRAVKGILATKVQLRTRRIDVTGECIMCGVEDETDTHCLLDCVEARNCWSWAGLNMKRGESSSIREWWREFINEFDMQSRERLACLCWAIWRQRNEKTWRGKLRSARESVGAGTQILLDWRAVNLRRTGARRSIAKPVEWKKPPAGWIKINTDAAVFEEIGVTGVGVIARDENGDVLGCFRRSFQGALEPKCAEAVAVREALSWIKKRVFSNVEVELDALGVVMSLNGAREDRSYFGELISECLLQARELSDSKFTFVSRVANTVAHRLARSMCLGNVELWDELASACIVDLFAQ